MSKSVTLTGWSLFYKGTSLQYPFVCYNKLISMWESTIVLGLKHGVSIDTQREQIKEDLDELEEWINRLVGAEPDGYSNFDLEKKLGEKDFGILLNKWGMNIVCGLKLKVITNDDMNGQLFVYGK